jgi:hypothetical protein
MGVCVDLVARPPGKREFIYELSKYHSLREFWKVCGDGHTAASVLEKATAIEATGPSCGWIYQDLIRYATAIVKRHGPETPCFFPDDSGSCKHIVNLYDKREERRLKRIQRKTIHP